MKECPRCFCEYDDFPATSRRDNKTEICPTCGTEEALVDYATNQGWKIPFDADQREKNFQKRLTTGE